MFDYRKVLFWIAALAVAYALFFDVRADKHPATSQPPVTVPVTDVPTAAPPQPVQTQPLPSPTQTPPIAAPVAPAPKASLPKRPKVQSRLTKRSKRKLDCSNIPAKAYQYPEDTVIAFAKARGVEDAGLAHLRRCIEAHRGG